MCEWVAENLGANTPIHFSAFHPDYKLRDLPPTPETTLEMARSIALDIGLNYVYIGNIYSAAANTYCPNCEKLLIQRNWYNVGYNQIQDGQCPDCHHPIPGVFA
ncbi:hypothetical protein GWN26_05390 [Candidatus Saccharibacteria bacterium]|nr:hypothetical protein [Candidatus Saccharibacteria bacterium]